MPRFVATVCLALLLIGPAAGEDAPSEDQQTQLRGEVVRLLQELDSDEFEVRHRAAGRLEELVARAELGRFLATEFGRAQQQLDVSFEVRWHLKRWCSRLPHVPPEPLQQISDDEINRLIEKLGDDKYGVRLGATRRLTNLLLRDEHLPRVKKALQARLAGTLDPEAAARVRKLLEPLRPAMVAEFWQGRRHLNQQHLLIGVPSQTAQAPRPSHFDRIDDEVAHCVSGVNLAPGDYPVGVAFPHPSQPGAFFRLVNLSTPGRQAAYKEDVKTDEAKRLAALTRRTLQRMLAGRHELSGPELGMLAQLDPREVSRFADKYFGLVEDKPLSSSAPNPISPYPSRFGMICGQLAVDGTQEATAGLLSAIEKNRFIAPTELAPYRLHWIAALSIANRDPWPAVDTWLSGLLDRDDALIEIEGYANGPELGATAAGVLLKRYRQPVSEFELQLLATSLKMQWRVGGYRYASPDTHKKVQHWWEQEKAKKNKP